MKAYVAIFLLVIVGAHASRDLSKYKPRWTLYPSLVKINGEWDPESRIVGGQEADPHSWPHQVALFIDNMYFCGGSLISDEWVLTAAHCADGAGFINVVAGAHNIREDEASQVELTSTDFFTHEDWNSFNLANDIALVRLPQSIGFTDEIKAGNLVSSSGSPPVGEIVTLTGWGRPSDSASGISDVLRQVDVPIMSNADCDAVYGIINEGIICVDAANGMGSCNGDSGGPMNTKGDKIAGVTSFGSSAGCEVGYPDGYTRVSYFRDWINEKTGI